MIRAELDGEGSFLAAPSDRRNLVPECGGVLDAQVAQSTDTLDGDPVARLPGGHSRPDGLDDADDFVARHNRFRRIGSQTFDGHGVCVVDAVGQHP
jgi:hypothetical protein